MAWVVFIMEQILGLSLFTQYRIKIAELVPPRPHSFTSEENEAQSS